MPVKPVFEHRFSATDRVFFDTNIWIKLFDCRSDPDKREGHEATKIYSGALRRALEAKSQLVTHAVVVSEFIHRLSSDEYHFCKQLEPSVGPYKTWRACAAGRSFARVLAAQTRQFLGRCECLPTDFSHQELSALVQKFEDDPCDFNDELVAALCLKHNLFLVTHDGDFARSDVPILTANTSYMRR